MCNETRYGQEKRTTIEIDDMQYFWFNWILIFKNAQNK